MRNSPASEVVVADASPIIHLDRAGCLDLLPALFRAVHVPKIVATEIAAGRELGLTVPDLSSLGWIRIDADLGDPDVERLPGLDAGEIAALSLARSIRADFVLIDDRAGREAAVRLRLRFLGTAGMLVLAKRREVIPAVRPLLDELATTGFRLSPEIRRRILTAAGELS